MIGAGKARKSGGDEELLAETLILIQQYEQNPEGWKALEEFEAELERSEAAPGDLEGEVALLRNSRQPAEFLEAGAEEHGTTLVEEGK